MFLSWEPNDCTIISLCLKCNTRNKTKETEDGSLSVTLKKVLKIHYIHWIHVKGNFSFYLKSCAFTEPNVRAEIMSHGLEKSVICSVLQKLYLLWAYISVNCFAKYIKEIPSSVTIPLGIFIFLHNVWPLSTYIHVEGKVQIYFRQIEHIINKWQNHLWSTIICELQFCSLVEPDDGLYFLSIPHTHSLTDILTSSFSFTETCTYLVELIS